MRTFNWKNILFQNASIKNVSAKNRVKIRAQKCGQKNRAQNVGKNSGAKKNALEPPPNKIALI